jgi:transcription termination factor 2
LRALRAPGTWRRQGCQPYVPAAINTRRFSWYSFLLIDNVIRKKDIVRFVKARRISWIGHVERMEDSRMPKRVMTEKIYTSRKRGRPKVRWLDDVQEDLREMGIEGLRRKAQDRDQWRRIAQEAKAHVGL